MRGNNILRSIVTWIGTAIAWFLIVTAVELGIRWLSGGPPLWQKLLIAGFLGWASTAVDD